MSPMDLGLEPGGRMSSRERHRRLDRARLRRLDSMLADYVDHGKLPGWAVLVSQYGDEVHRSSYGWRDPDQHLPITHDTLFRIYSMTKPVTAVAAMILYEEGAFQLTDPVSTFIPAFGDQTVCAAVSSDGAMEVVPSRQPMLMWHLLTHTSGLGYGAPSTHPVDVLYRSAGFQLDQFGGGDLAANCDSWAGFPLLFEPGTRWSYSVSSDVLGRVVEVLSGEPLDRFMRTRIFEPLGMADTAFSVEPDASERLAALYVRDDGLGIRRDDRLAAAALRTPVCLSGGAGLISTLDDYHRFAQMLLGQGKVGDIHLLSTRTVQTMSSNHLPGGTDIESIAHPLFPPDTFHGVGYGFGLATVTDPVSNKSLSAKGEISWGGAASTLFWVDPVDDVVVVFMTQVRPSSTYPLRSTLRQVVYQAMVAE